MRMLEVTRGQDIAPEAFSAFAAMVEARPGYPELMTATAESPFADSHPQSRVQIVWRYLEAGIPVALAAAAIRRGYSSPSAFKRRGVLRALQRGLGI